MRDWSTYFGSYLIEGRRRHQPSWGSWLSYEVPRGAAPADPSHSAPRLSNHCALSSCRTEDHVIQPTQRRQWLETKQFPPVMYVCRLYTYKHLFFITGVRRGEQILKHDQLKIYYKLTLPTCENIWEPPLQTLSPSTLQPTSRTSSASAHPAPPAGSHGECSLTWISPVEKQNVHPQRANKPNALGLCCVHEEPYHLEHWEK